MRAAMAMTITGESEAAGKLCNIPGRTIRWWMDQDWWPSLVQDARRRKSQELDGIFTSIIHKATSQIVDRLDNGDTVILAKTGEEKKRPVGAKDLAIITSILVDKRALGRGEATTRSDRVGTKDRINGLLNEFDEAGKKEPSKKIKEEEEEITLQ